MPLAPGDSLDLPHRIGILASTRTCGDQWKKASMAFLSRSPCRLPRQGRLERLH
jgi:hypothetical protein